MRVKDLGVSRPSRKSCASIAVQCLSDAGIVDWKTAFDHHIDNAKQLGLMPDDFKVIKKTLQDFSFFMQNTRLENVRINNLVNKLQGLNDSAVVFVNVFDYGRQGGDMVALSIAGNGYRVINPRGIPITEVGGYMSSHVWIHWNDGIDRSPFPRRTNSRSQAGSSSKKTYQETEYYKPYQPNPRSNYIGDCVVRAVAGVMDISWEDALDRLASSNETSVNDREVYPDILESNGYHHHKPIMREGHRLKGKAFCDEMKKRYFGGERVFAHVGRSHVAAIVPINNIDGYTTYKIIDSWDSSERTIGDFWVGPPEIVKESNHKTQALYSFTVGEGIQHPSFGCGVITAVSSSVVTVDFGEKGLRRLGTDWVRYNCRDKSNNNSDIVVR